MEQERGSNSLKAEIESQMEVYRSPKGWRVKTYRVANADGQSYIESDDREATEEEIKAAIRKAEEARTLQQISRENIEETDGKQKGAKKDNLYHIEDYRNRAA